MFGAIYGDVIGSYYENHCTKDYNFPFQSDATYTDDSMLIAAVCQAILNDSSPIKRRDLTRRAKEYAAQYRQFYSHDPYAGYGEMFRAWAQNGRARNGKSYANGAAMRVIPIGLSYDTMEQVLLQTRASCMPTHSHKEAIIAAYAVSSAVFMAKNGEAKQAIKTYLERHYYRDLSTPLSEIRKVHVFDSRASYSVPAALIAFLESEDYESAIRNAISLGGDADTQACIAGGIAEAYYKEIPSHIVRFYDSKIDLRIKIPVKQLTAKLQKTQ